MKAFIISLALIIVLASFNTFQIDNNKYLQSRELYKMAADDCADAAALFYDEEEFSNGIKIFNKHEGNKVILHILNKALGASGELAWRNKYVSNMYNYFVYYIDGDGTYTSYKGNTVIEKKRIVFPYTFRESLTEYEQIIYEATVVVTIDAGKFNYRLRFIEDPDLVRTSGYEYWAY